MFGFSGWNCLKNYKKIEGGLDTDDPPITDDCQYHEICLLIGYRLSHSLFYTLSYNLQTLRLLGTFWQKLAKLICWVAMAVF